jgi:hypothetical protein
VTTIATVRAAITAHLAAIPDIGRVHATRRDAKAANDIKADFHVAGVGLRVWLVANVTVDEQSDTLSIVTETMDWDIDGFVAFDGGEGETVLDGLVDAIRDAFRDTDLGITGLTTITADRTGVAVVDRQPVLLGRGTGLVCAAAKLRLTTTIN